MPKPSAPVTWATDATWLTGPDVGDPPRGAAAIPGAFAAQGWIGASPIPARYLNRLFGELSDWSAWADEGEAGFSTTAHPVETDAGGVATAFAFQADTTGDTIGQPYTATSDAAAVASVGCFNAGAGGDSNGFVALVTDGHGWKVTLLNETRAHGLMVPASALPTTKVAGGLGMFDGPSRAVATLDVDATDTHLIDASPFGHFGFADTAPDGAFTAGPGYVSIGSDGWLEAEGPLIAGSRVIVRGSLEAGEAAGSPLAGNFSIRVRDVTAAVTVFERTGIQLHQGFLGVGVYERDVTFAIDYVVPATGTRTFALEIDPIAANPGGVQVRDVFWSVEPAPFA